MHLLHETTEADMVAVFLKGELTSDRFGHLIRAQLERDQQVVRVIDTPDITNTQENAYRRHILAAYRPYVFDELPADIRWRRVLLERDEIATIRYIDYDYWNELSGGTRLPAVAAETIRAGREIYSQSNQRFLDAAQALCAGAQFPEMIIVGISPHATLAVYEGHLRLTAYVLAPECIPEPIEAIAGFAPECARI